MPQYLAPNRPRHPRPAHAGVNGAAARLRFPDECCFPVIYFVPNIFSLWFGSMPGAGFADTKRLTQAVNNAWATRRLAGLGEI
jgi:hypothetical protein